MTFNSAIKRMEESATGEQKVVLDELNNYVVMTLINNEKFDCEKLYNMCFKLNSVYPEFVSMMYALSIVAGHEAFNNNDDLTSMAKDFGDTEIDI